MPIPSHITDPQYLLELIRFAFERRNIQFSKAVAAKIVGGEYQLEKLVKQGKIRMDKPSAKQNGKWFCNGGDVMRNIRL